MCWNECSLLGKPECERVDPEEKVMCLKYKAQKTIDEEAYTTAIINWLDDNEISPLVRCSDIIGLVQILKNIDSDRPIQGMESSSFKPDQKE